MDEKYCTYETRNVLFDELADVFNDNIRFFANRSKPIDVQFVTAFERIINVIEPTRIALDELTKICAQFDVDSFTKGNGFRSLICITEKCLFKILEIGIYIQKSRDRFFFRSYHNFMEIESYSQVASRLFTVTQVALSLGTILDDDSLFADDDKFPDEVDGLMNDFETIGRECFYGRSFGFQFSPALQQSLNVIAVALAAYGDGFKRHNGNTARALSSVLHSGKYVVDPELRARRIVELTQHVSIPFCKSFWSLTESHGIQHVPMLICPTLSMNKELKIAVEPLVIETHTGQRTIDPPFLISKSKVINARLLSYSQREGQGRASSNDRVAESFGRRMHGLSKNLLLHCHGGGFVAQSSKSHEIYLRSWAKDLQCPILSIDYSLSPDAPYPEALNECFYVYNWAIQNCKTLGWTAERVCLAGDSAGGNLMVALTLKLIEEGLRPPDGIVAAYPPLRVQYAPSPSRMLALMDPLLPPGILKVCLRAYAGNVHDDVIKESSSTSSLHRAVFDDFYNPFDLDLGDVAYAARRRNETSITGKRSYSDSNLFIGGHYCVSRPVVGCIRCKKLSNQSQRKSSIVSENDVEEDGLQMHPIQTGALESKDVGDKGTNSVQGMNESKKTAVSEDRQQSELLDNSENSSENLLGKRDKLNSAESSGTVKDSLASSSECELIEIVSSASEIGALDHVVIRRSKSYASQSHRRSLSDSIAESFQRLRPNADDFEMARRLSSNDSVSGESGKERSGSRNASPVETRNSVNNDANIEKDSKGSGELHSNVAHKTEYKALYIKETSDCVIIDRGSQTVISTSGVDKIEKVYERQGSADSISSSIKRKSKDPLMSPLLASDRILQKLPKLIIVACSLDPLLDDAVDFIRRLKKLQKDSELFIVDDLPHGFLNLNFASSEAKEASELIVACIKRVLKIGLKHENSFPVSPEAMEEEFAKSAV